MKFLKYLKRTNMLRSFLFATIIACISCTASKNNVGSQIKVFSGPVISCGSASIFQLNEEKDSYILVKLDMAEINASSKIKIGDPGIEVRLVKFDGDVSNAPCNDVMYDTPKKLNEQLANSGILELIIPPEELEKKRSGSGYRIDVMSTNLTFNDGSVFEVSVKNAFVGWLPG